MTINIKKYFASLKLLICIIILVLFFCPYINFVYGNNEVVSSEQTNSRIFIAFRNDDISSRSDLKHEYQILKIFQKYKIKPLYAVIPISGNKPIKKEMEIANYLREWHSKGWIDIAQHGYTHKKNKYSLGEFRQLSYVEQLDKIKNGKNILDIALNMDVKIFCPPWNAADDQTLQALSTCRFNIFSGAVGRTKPQNIREIDCNCNLFEGSLISLINAYKEAKLTNDHVLLIALYHTRADFNENRFQEIESLLSLLERDSSVKFVSFGDLQGAEYKELIENQNKLSNIIYDFRHDFKVRVIRKISKVSGIKLIDTDELQHQIRNSIWKNNHILIERFMNDVERDINLYLVLISSGAAIVLFVIIAGFRKYNILRFNKKTTKLNVK